MNFGKVVVYIAYVDRSIEAKELEHELYQLGRSGERQTYRNH